MNIQPEWTVLDISRRYPATTPVLSKHRIDLCCGGQHPLRFVAEKHGLDLATLLRELDDAVAAGTR